MKKLIISLLVFGFIGVQHLHAQPDLPKTQKAYGLMKSGKFIAAKDQVLIALKDEQESESPYTWLVKSYIFKELYKTIDSESKYSENREIAVDALLRSMELDDDKVYLDEHQKAVKYLAFSYYNDAVSLVENINTSNYEEAPRFFERYYQLYSLVDRDNRLKHNVIEFNNAYGYKIRMLAEANEDLYSQLTNIAIDSYENSLAKNPNDTLANYNLAVLYYNQGVSKIKKINYQTEIFELITIQDECLKKFKKALPYMLKTYELDPEISESLKGLMAIYKAMNDDEKSDAYKRKLEELIKSGRAK